MAFTIFNGQFTALAKIEQLSVESEINPGYTRDIALVREIAGNVAWYVSYTQKGESNHSIAFREHLGESEDLGDPPELDETLEDAANRCEEEHYDTIVAAIS